MPIGSPEQAEAGPSMTTAPIYQVGGRYLHAKTRYPLMVKYVGPLPPPSTSTPAPTNPDTKDAQIWIGVEYDDPSHGRGHDGLYKDIRVFQTLEKGSAAFLKLVGKPLISGNSLVDSIQERYGSILPSRPAPSGHLSPSGSEQPSRLVEHMDSANPATQSPNEGKAGPSAGLQVDTVVLGSSNAAIVVQAPNLSSVRERVGKLEKIRNMGFEEEWVERLGGDDEMRLALKDRMKGLKWLNLSRNLISSWQTVADIIQHFEGLEILTLNHSRISVASINKIPDEEEFRLRSVFGKIKELHLSDCQLSDEDVGSLVPIFPNLVTLHLEANRRLTGVDRPYEELEQLRELRLAGCPISSWDGISPLVDHLPKLESLDLSYTKISSIPPPSPIFSQPEEAALNSFDPGSVSTPKTKSRTISRTANLTSLTMISSELQTWSDLDNLSLNFPSLALLRFSLSPEAVTVEPSKVSSASNGKVTSVSQISRDEKQLRLTCIAKFANLEYFNSNIISTTERRDAELFYIGLVQKSIIVREDGTRVFAHDEQRFEALCKKHGVDLLDAKGTSSGQGNTKNKDKKSKSGLKGKMIDLLVYTSDRDPLPISILPTAPVSLLQKKVSRLVGAPMSESSSLILYSVSVSETNPSQWEKAVRIGGEWGETVGWWFSDGDGVFAEPDTMPN